MQYVFGAGQLFIQPLGADSLATGPMQIAALQGVSLDFAFSAKALHGDGAHWPFAVGRGTGNIPIKAEYARFTAAGFNAMLFGAADPLPVGMTRTAADEPQTVAGGAVAATHAADFMEDLGVTDAAEGLIYTKVSAAPVGLQYTCDDAGGYGFNSSRNGQPVLINYTYDHAASGYRLAVNNRNMGHTPRFSAVLTGTFNGKATTLTLNACTAGKLSLATKSESFTIPSFSFAAAADDAGVVGTWSMEEGGDDTPGEAPAPATQFLEDFESGLGSYTATGNASLFTLVGSDYGDSLSVAEQNSGTASAITRATPTLSVSTLKIKFKLNSLGPDDACTATLVNGLSTVVSFNPRREAAFDPTRRARLSLPDEDIPITDASLTQGQWYQLAATIAPGVGNTVCTIVELPSGNLVKTTVFSLSHSPPTINGLVFVADSGGLTSATDYDDIAINYS